MRGPVRARHEPELPLQAQGGRRGTGRRRPPSVAQRGRSLHSKWWTIGWYITVAAFFAHVAALSLLPLSLAQAVLSGGFVLLAVLAERYFGFSLGRRQWLGVSIVAVALLLRV